MIEHIYALKAGLDLSNSFDAAVWAVACIAFWCCCRLGELVIPSDNLFNGLKHVARGTSVVHNCTGLGVKFATMHIPWSKTTQAEGADISITAHEDLSCPYIALKHHLLCSPDVPPSAPFFSFATIDRKWAPMTKPWFMARCNEIWVEAGLPDIPGHGYRIGGATHLLLTGVAPDIVAVLGRWKSRAFLDYWRQIQSILPLFLSAGGGSSRCAIVESSMDAYKKKYQLN